MDLGKTHLTLKQAPEGEDLFLHLVPLSLAGGMVALLIWLRLEVRKLLRLAAPIVPRL